MKRNSKRKDNKLAKKLALLLSATLLSGPLAQAKSSGNSGKPKKLNVQNSEELKKSDMQDSGNSEELKKSDVRDKKLRRRRMRNKRLPIYLGASLGTGILLKTIFFPGESIQVTFDSKTKSVKMDSKLSDCLKKLGLSEEEDIDAEITETEKNGLTTRNKVPIKRNGAYVAKMQDGKISFLDLSGDRKISIVFIKKSRRQKKK
jgi:hypothetical protein